MTDGWGWPKSDRLAGTPLSDTSDRAARRAEDRERRAQERLAAAEQRSESRIAQRDALSQERERARESRRIEETARHETRLNAPPTNDVEALKISKRRRSGALARSGEETKKERDTRSYTTIVDPQRIRTLADRGASLAALAGAFGISVEEVEAALLETAAET
ncbi:hypothetical protein U1707_11010 [Sphingomonas sp. PB2P12]|uniref:hypothetical protein n=1 Tax=Sphingomonas sandaracina TaxID=3096157 RepID=UPI002FCB9E49